MRILQPNYEKSVGKGHLFKRVIVAGTMSEGAPCNCFVCVCGGGGGMGVCVV